MPPLFARRAPVVSRYDDVDAYCSRTPLAPSSLHVLRTRRAVFDERTDLDEFEALLATFSYDYALSVCFDPRLIDACCTRGIFPMALNIDADVFLFLAKLHVEQAVCALSDKAICVADTRIAPLRPLRVRKRFVRDGGRSADVHRTVYKLYINRESDMQRVCVLIDERHEGCWLCVPLQLCLLCMLRHPDRFTTRVIVSAVWRCRYDASGACVDEELVAGEVGYVVGDMYTSMTGACTESGSGRLQLAATAAAMRALGVTIWDLGMPLPYKMSMLGCSLVPRAAWVALVREHRSRGMPTVDATLSYEALSGGIPVVQLVSC